MATKQLKASYVLDADGVRKGAQQADQHLSGLEGALSRTKAVGVGAFGAFSGVLREVGGEVAGPLMASVGGLGEAFNRVAERVEKLGESGSKLQKLGAGLAGVGGAAAGVGIGIEALGSPMEEARKQLEAAVSAAGGEFDDLKGRVGSTEKQMEQFGHRSTDTDQALATLTEGLHDPAKALDEMSLAANIAAARHVSLTSAADMLVKAHAGSSRVFKQFGIDVNAAGNATKELAKAQDILQKSTDDHDAAVKRLNDLVDIQHSKSKLTEADHVALRNAQEKVTETANTMAASTRLVASAQAAAKDGSSQLDKAMGELAQRVSGQASASVDSMGGRLRVLKAEVLDGAAALGQKYGPAVTAAGAGVALLGGVMDGAGAIIRHFATATEVATTATEGMEVAETGMGAASTIALGPIGLIIAAIAAIAFGVYELIHHWGAVKEFFVRLWDDVKTIFFDAWHTIVNALPLIIAAMVAPIALGVYEIVEHWAAVKQFFFGLWGDVKAIFFDAWHAIHGALADAWGGLEGWFKALPGNILNAIKDIGSLLYQKGIDLLAGLIAGQINAAVAFFQWYVDLPGNILNLLVSAASWLVDAGSRIVHGLANGLVAAAPMVWDFWLALPGRVLGFLVDANKWLIDVGVRVIRGLVDGVESNVSALWGWLQSLPGRLVDSAVRQANIVGRVAEIGTNVIQGIIQGIKAAASDLFAAAGKVVSDLIDSVKSKLHIGSPSKVFAEMGRYTMEGLRDGIAANAHLPIGALAGVADGMGQFALTLPGAAVAAGGSTRPAGLGTAAAPMLVVNVTVQGNVTTERDLVDAIHGGLLAKQQRQPLGFTS